ncbi:MAG: amidohydrolase family protein, partial [Candidatus Kapaibacteriota bacterium]
TKYLRNFYLDSLTHDENMLYFLVKMFGSDRLALGTDYPFPLGELQPGKLIENSYLNIEDKENLFYKTALEWLGLDKKSFI